MPLETRCVWCSGPLLDAEHAKKHVLEQCTKAPWRERLADLERKNTRLQELLASYQHPLVAAGKAQSAHEVLAENTRLSERVRELELFIADTGITSAQEDAAKRLRDLRTENTRLREAVTTTVANIDRLRATIEAGFVDGKDEDATRRHERYVGAYAALDERSGIEANRLRDALRTPGGDARRQPCRACGGSGRVGDAPCGSCGGSGKGQTR